MTSKTRITVEETRHVALLSKLEFSEPELLEINREMEQILGTVSKMSEVPVDGLEATLAVGAYSNRFREDQVAETLPREQALANAPKLRDGHFEIPRILSRS